MVQVSDRKEASRELRGRRAQLGDVSNRRAMRQKRSSKKFQVQEVFRCFYVCGRGLPLRGSVQRGGGGVTCRGMSGLLLNRVGVSDPSGW